MFDFQYLRLYARLSGIQKVHHFVTVAWLLLVTRGAFMLIMAFYSRVFHTDFRNGSEDQYLVKAMAALPEKTEVLFVGSSHIKLGVRPSRFTVPVMSLAVNGLDYRCSEKVIEVNLGKVPNLKICVLEYDDVPVVVSTIDNVQGNFKNLYLLGLTRETMRESTWREKAVALENEAVYQIFFPIDRLPRITPATFFYFAHVNEALDPEIEKNGKLGVSQGTAGETTDMNSAISEPGFVGLRVAMKQSKEVSVAQDRFKQINDIMAISGGDANVPIQFAAFCRTIEFLEKKGVKVVLLRAPHPAIYWKYRPDSVKTKFQRFDQAFRTRYANDLRDRKVELWDYGHDSDFVRGDFYDADHLNIEGANKFAPILDERLIQMLSPGVKH